MDGTAGISESTPNFFAKSATVRDPRRDYRVGQFAPPCHAQAAVVKESAGPALGDKQLVADRIEHNGGDDLAIEMAKIGIP